MARPDDEVEVPYGPERPVERTAPEGGGS